MTCKGYDVKAVKVPKQVKRSSIAYLDAHVRGAFVRSFVKILENDMRTRGNRNRDKTD